MHTNRKTIAQKVSGRDRRPFLINRWINLRANRIAIEMKLNYPKIGKSLAESIHKLFLYILLSFFVIVLIFLAYNNTSLFNFPISWPVTLALRFNLDSTFHPA